MEVPPATHVDHCRICYSKDVEPLFSIGAQYVNGFLNKDEDPGEKVPIELVYCRQCTLVYLKHTAPQEILYSRHYWYRSGITNTMRMALAEIAELLEETVPLKQGDVILDIGSNDGTLLRSYKNNNAKTVGVEPADNLVDAGQTGVDCFIHDFWNYETYDENVGKQAKIITALGMFYDLDDPNKFIGDIGKALAPDGVFVAQLMCLQDMYQLNDVGNLAHEHLEFYSLKSLDYIFGKYGMEIYDISYNAVNGQSTRLFVRQMDSDIAPEASPEAALRLQQARAAEEKFSDMQTYKDMFESMELARKQTVDFIRKAVDEGKKVWVYGASTKGNTILQYYELDHTLIEGAAERSPEKWGKFTVGTKIPIYSEAYAREVNPDYFLVLPYAFLPEFIERESEWRDNGGLFIVPIPEFRVV